MKRRLAPTRTAAAKGRRSLPMTPARRRAAQRHRLYHQGRPENPLLHFGGILVFATLALVAFGPF